MTMCVLDCIAGFLEHKKLTTLAATLTSFFFMPVSWLATCN